MTVAFDAFDAGTDQNNANDQTWTHTPVGTARGVVVLQVENGTGDKVDSVTYGSLTLTEVAGSPNDHTTGELGTIHCFFGGSGLPSGAQTVTVSRNATSRHMGASSTVTSASVDTEVVDTDASINSDSLSSPSATLALAGRTCYVAEALFSGRAALVDITPLAGWTDRQEFDRGSRVVGWYDYDTIGSADVTMGWTQGADDAVCIGVAVSEVVAAAAVIPSLVTAPYRAAA